MHHHIMKVSARLRRPDLSRCKSSLKLLQCVWDLAVTFGLGIKGNQRAPGFPNRELLNRNQLTALIFLIGSFSIGGV